MVANIFVSYASEDRTWVARFVVFHDVLEHQIDTARCVIVVWTVNSVSKVRG